jgi:chromosome segregation ATPase
LNCRFLELQEQFNDVTTKYGNIDKSKQKLQSQFDSLSEDYEKTKKKCDEVVKREKALDKEAEELRTKLTIANAELDAAFHSSRTHASELSRYKHLTDQLSEQLDTLQKDKRKLSDEFETASTQLLEAQSKLSDLERKCKIIEIDRQQLQNDLDDAKDQLQVETNRITNLNSQIDKIKLETDKKLSDKDDELDLQRTTHRRQLEALQHQLEENENKHKNDLSSTRKKLLNEIEELKAKYESAKKAKTDSEAQNKKLQQTNKVRFDFVFCYSFVVLIFLNGIFLQELLEKLNEEQLYNDSVADQLANAEKRVSSLKAELEESKTLLDKVSIFYLYSFLMNDLLKR